MSTVVKGWEGTISVGGETLGVFENVDHNLSADDEDITAGEDGGWENWQQGVKRLEASVEALYVLTNNALAAIYTAWLADDDLAYSATDGNGYGWSCQVGVLSIDEGIPSRNRITLSVELKSRGTVTRITPGS